ncbi:Y-family DNA polymerase [Amaricoccus sp.]|uniref:Y-family DNA polymerase n=1 Tax=Amaricoccus sp. TaxID=1872485 RepID=UPI0039E608DD
MRRILSLWFPRLASDCLLRRAPHDGPFALILRQGGADHLHCLNATAATEGLHRGMPLADARALCPRLATAPADLAAEAACLGRLVRWAGRFSPQVARDGSDGLLADLTGAAALFGGEAAVLRDARARLSRAGIEGVGAIADSRGAARALARHGGGIAPPGRPLAALGALPPTALRLDAATAAALDALGIRSIGALDALPRAPLGQRFGPGLLARLDQALGRAPEPLEPEAPPPALAVRLTLPEPIGLVRDVEAGLARLLDRLCPTLARHGLGARALRLELGRVDGATVAVTVGLARPVRDPARIAPLFRPGIEGVDAGFGLDRLRLVATRTEPLAPVQIAAGGARDGTPQAEALADLVSRLGNRLGFARITTVAPAESHAPEKSFLVLPAAFAPEAPTAPWPPGRPRPLLLFPPEPVEADPAPAPPAAFRWRRVAFITRAAAGPERIAPEWWLDDPAWRTGLRAYWRVATTGGRRLWLFHTPQAPGWYAQGEFP